MFSDYKSRLSCVSSCFSVYSALAPHHNLARYCIQASCPADQQLPQLDCFSQCSSHVSRGVAPEDWELWAAQLTSTCQEDNGSGRYHRSGPSHHQDFFPNIFWTLDCASPYLLPGSKIILTYIHRSTPLFHCPKQSSKFTFFASHFVNVKVIL